MSRAEFLAEANALGLNPKQAMDRLGVRSLSGLNLREALATLQRLSLRANGETGTAPTPKAAEPAGATPARASVSVNRPDARQATPSRPLSRPAPPPPPSAPASARREPATPAYGFE